MSPKTDIKQTAQPREFLTATTQERSPLKYGGLDFFKRPFRADEQKKEQLLKNTMCHIVGIIKAKMKTFQNCDFLF